MLGARRLAEVTFHFCVDRASRTSAVTDCKIINRTTMNDALQRLSALHFNGFEFSLPASAEHIESGPQHGERVRTSFKWLSLRRRPSFKEPGCTRFLNHNVRYLNCTVLSDLE